MPLWHHRTLFSGLLFLFLGYRTAWSHVRLEYPPARYPDLDFLDNVRTPAPCGVAKTRSSGSTTLESGSRFNVTWIMTYAHQGGFRIEILDDTGQPIYALTPEEQQFTGLNDQTKERYEVQLPADLICDDCTIRLMREAREWGGSYDFYSCADVKIVKNLQDKCSGKGQWAEGKCLCTRLYSGSACQFKDECWEDKDCGPNGRCVDIQTSHYPRNQCYCKLGFYGSDCSRISEIKSKDFDAALYESQSLGAFDKLYWRILQDTQEIEMIMQYASTSWVAVGWKPLDIDPKCARLPVSEPQQRSQVTPAAEPEPVGGNVWVSQNETHLHNTVPVVEPVAEPEIPAKTSPNPIINNVAQTGANASVTAEPTAEPAAEPKPEPTQPEPTPEQHSNFTIPSIINQTEWRPHVPANGSAEPEPTLAVPVQPEPEPAKTAKPNVDNAIESPAVSWQPQQTERVTTTDVPVTPGSPPLSVSVLGTTPRIPDYSTVVHQLPVVAVTGDVCYGEWSWPPGCLGTNTEESQEPCDYRASWTYLIDTDEIEFSLEARVPANWWTGIGFSKSGLMPGADMIIATVTNTEKNDVKLYDAYGNGYDVPRRDNVQNVQFQGGTHINGVLRVGFTRKRNTGDIAHDVQFSDTECVYFMFPVAGGRLDDQGWITKHLDLPKNSSVPVCIKACPQQVAPVHRECTKDYKYPPGCVPPDCDYYATWQFYPNQEDVLFQITAKTLGRWTGIGFGREPNMTNSDIVVGWMFHQQAYLTDRFAYGKHQPAIDTSQDIYGIGGIMEDDRQTIWFRRKIITSDKREDLPLLECLYYEFPVGGGRVLARTAEEFSDKNTAIGYHDFYVPKISKDLICICTDDGQPLLNKRKRQVAQVSAVLEESHVEPEGAPEPATEPEPKAEHANATSHTVPNSKAEPEAGPEVHAEPESASEPHGHGEPEPHGHGEPEPSAEGRSQTASQLHAMDCTDIIVGSARQDLSRIGDFYTISRATPREDTFYGGNDSLTSALGYEENGVTTIMFRKPLKGLDPADHSIVDGAMTVIWAKGQERGQYSHAPQSALEKGPAANGQGFYEPDVLKYHGAKNRGQFTINFHRNSQACQCCDKFSLPGQYAISWELQDDYVVFNLEAKIRPARWTGIGFSKTGHMSDADMIVTQVNADGTVITLDRHSLGYNTPIIDKDQNVFNAKGSYADGNLKVTFSRPLVSLDVDGDVNLTSCVYFLYPQTGGPISETELLAHENNPIVSREQICVTKCKPLRTSTAGAELNSTQPTSLPTKKPTVVPAAAVPIPEPIQNKFVARMVFPDEIWSADLTNSESQRYKHLSGVISSALDSWLKQNLVGFERSRIMGFSAGSIVAEVEIVTGSEESLENLRTALNTFLMTTENRVGNMHADPAQLTVKQVKGDEVSTEQLRNWIIIGVASFLVFISLIFAICLIVRSKRRRAKFPHKDMAPLPPYYPFPCPPQGSLPRPAYLVPYGPPAPMTEKVPYAVGADIARSASALGQQPLAKGKERDGAADSPKGGLNGASAAGANGGETSFSDWYQKVNKEGPESGESSQETTPRRRPRNEQGDSHTQPAPGAATAAQAPADGRSPMPYVTYPGDPYGYYTLGGQNRLHGRGMPPPGYYRPF